MRDGIYVENLDGTKSLSLRKLLGQGYNQAWYTNCKARYRVFRGARSTKKSVDLLSGKIYLSQI